MIRVILFDMGGVYLHGSFVDFVNRAYKILGIKKSFHVDKEVVFDEALNKGIVTLEECFRKYFDVPISDGQMKKIKDLWMSTCKPLDEMVNLVKSLKKNYRLGIISNSDAVNSKNYSEWGWYDHFELLILSHEVGVIKPDKKIYELAIQKLKVKPEECLFIDDQEDCLKPARELGMETILFKSVPQLKEELKKRGIKF